MRNVIGAVGSLVKVGVDIVVYLTWVLFKAVAK